MIEMLETATILQHATSHSLVLLDEVGRGTSTYDGVSIARAVAEYLHDVLACRTFFATHYHELTDLPARRARIFNTHMEVKENRGAIVFLRQLKGGSANRSYGIQVARLAALPEQVLLRAQEILDELEKSGKIRTSKKASPVLRSQLPLFE
jgi:DNA mismatch repair protein MutS